MIPDLKIFNTKRYGRIELSPESYEMFWKSCKLEIIPLKLDFIPHRQVFVLECFCEAFRELSESDGIPNYEITFIKINEHIAVEKVEERK